VIARVSSRPLNDQVTSVIGVIDRLRAEIRLAEQGPHRLAGHSVCLRGRREQRVDPQDESVRDAVMSLCRGSVSRYLAACH